MDCVNLKERFGNRFKIQHEESYAAERSEFRTAQEPWLQIIPCRHGHICPCGRSTLAACTDKAGGVARRLKALPFTTVAQDGDDGANILFDMEHFEAVAEIIKPKRLPGPRKLTEEQRAKLVAASVPYRFKPKVAAGILPVVRGDSEARAGVSMG